MTGAEVPAPLVRAFWWGLRAEVPDLHERPCFLRQVVEGAVGPLPRPGDPDTAGSAPPGIDDRVPLEAAVALAVAVAEQFDGPVAPVRRTPKPSPDLQAVSGRDALRELVRRARRRVPGARR